MLSDDFRKIELLFTSYINQIYDFAFRHATNSFNTVPDIHDEVDIRLFIAIVHTGFRLAQDKIIETLLWLEDEASNNQEKIKQYDKARTHHLKDARRD